MIKKIDIGPQSKICVKWNIAKGNYSKEEEYKIIQLMSKKYGIPSKQIHVEKNYVTVGDKNDIFSSSMASNVYDPKFQLELMKQYISLNDIRDVDFDEIVKIDSQINSLIDYNSYQKSKHYGIEWVKWSNFLSYGPDNYFDFRNLKGLVLLNGQPANKSGKSTFAYDLLHFLLFGKTSSDKAKTYDQMFNNYLPESRVLNVEGCISIDGEKYIIKRTLTRPDISKKTRKITAKVEYYRLLDDGTEELLTENEQGVSTTATTKIIKEAIGNESDFDLIISANSRDLDNLICYSETEKGRLLARWIGLSVIEDKDILARNKWNKEINVGRYSSMYDKVTLLNDIEQLTIENKKNNEFIENNCKLISESNNKSQEYNIQRDALLSSKRKIDETLMKVDIQTLNSTLSKIVEDGKNKKNELEYCNNCLKEYGEINYSEENYKSMKSENENLIAHMSEIKAIIHRHKLDIEKLQQGEYCPTCKRKLDNVDNSETIAKINEEIASLTKDGIASKKRSDELISAMNAIEENRQKYIEKSKLELKIATIGSDIKSLRIEYQEKNNLLNDIQKNKESIEENNKIDNALNIVNNNIKVEENYKNKLIEENNECSTNIAKNNEVIALKKSYVVKINEELKIERYWKLYLQMIGKDGITKIVLRNTLPIINGELNNLLSDVTDFDVEIEMDDKNDIDFKLIRDGVKTRLSAASGLERTQAALALRVVLGKMSNISKPPFIFLDEILGTVDREYYDDMKRLYDKISTFYDFILHITHLSEIADWHDTIITVKKEDNISSITKNS